MATPGIFILNITKKQEMLIIMIALICHLCSQNSLIKTPSIIPYT